RFYRTLFDFVPKNGGIVIDWGCGGGLLASELLKYFSTIAVDISQNSLNECKKYTSNKCKQYILVDDFNVNINNVYLLHSSAVIHHFPSIDYFNDVVSL